MWYFARDGQMVGPMEKRELIDRAGRAEFGPDDLVWHPDFGAAWRPARTVEGLLFAAPPAAPGPSVPVVVGTGGSTHNRDITRRAREALRGRWGIAVGFTILLQMLVFAVVMVMVLVNTVLPLAGSLLQVAIVMPLSVGGLIFYLALSRGREISLGQMFGGFRSWWQVVGANLMMVVLFIGWALAVLLPFGIVAVALAVSNHLKRGEGAAVVLLGAAWLVYVLTVIVLSYRYAMTFFAIADDPACGPVEAIRRSVHLMRGAKWKLFRLSWRFFGWALLCSLTCGIGILWLAPYMAVSMAGFYDDLKRPEP
jgi:uncharacterized membrane protein